MQIYSAGIGGISKKREILKKGEMHLQEISQMSCYYFRQILLTEKIQLKKKKVGGMKFYKENPIENFFLFLFGGKKCAICKENPIENVFLSFSGRRKLRPSAKFYKENPIENFF